MPGHPPWDESYQHGPAPWEIGGPQPAIARLAAAGAFTGTVLDAGCGSGDNGLHLAGLGLRVVGVDVAETAIARAQQKALAAGADAEFVLGSAFELERLGETFDAVLDCGLFHTFDAAEQRAYADNLAAVTRPGARVHILCFRAPPAPHPIAEGAIEAAFADGWTVVSMEPDELHTRLDPAVMPAWLVTVEHGVSSAPRWGSRGLPT